MKITIEDINKQFQGSIFEDCCGEVKYNLYWVKWLLTCENSYSNDKKLNPILKVFEEFKKRSLEFLLDDNIPKIRRLKAFWINDSFPKIMDIVYNWLSKDLNAYNSNIKDVNFCVFKSLTESKEENIFLKIFNSSCKIKEMKKSIVSLAEELGY